MKLKDCSKYAVGVSIWQSSKHPTPPSNWLRFRTKYDPRSPPKNAKAFYDETDALFTWKHSCNRTGDQPDFYLFRVHDLLMNTIEDKQVFGLSYVFGGIYHGSQFNFSVATSAINAKPIVWFHEATPLPAPIGLEHISKGNNTFEFNWSPISMDHETWVIRSWWKCWSFIWSVFFSLSPKDLSTNWWFPTAAITGLRLSMLSVPRAVHISIDWHKISTS